MTNERTVGYCDLCFSYDSYLVNNNNKIIFDVQDSEDEIKEISKDALKDDLMGLPVEPTGLPY